MINIEKQLLDSRKSDVKNINEDEFLYKLEMRVRHSKDNRRTVIYSFMMLIVLSILTISQYDNPVMLDSTNYIDEMENIFETDLWNIDINSLDYDSLYLYDMAYILLEEGYLWEAYELISVSKSQKRNL